MAALTYLIRFSVNSMPTYVLNFNLISVITFTGCEAISCKNLTDNSVEVPTKMLED